MLRSSTEHFFFQNGAARLMVLYPPPWEPQLPYSYPLQNWNCYQPHLPQEHLLNLFSLLPDGADQCKLNSPVTEAGICTHMNIMLKCAVTLCRKTRLSLMELQFTLVSVVITELRDISLSNRHSERNFIYRPAYNTTCILTRHTDILSSVPLVPIETSLGATVGTGICARDSRNIETWVLAMCQQAFVLFRCFDVT